MSATTASPASRQHERQQPSKYFTTARSSASASPPALNQHRQALSSTTPRVSAFVPASSLVKQSVIAGLSPSPAQSSASLGRHSDAQVPDVGVAKKAQKEVTSRRMQGRDQGIGKKMALSEEFVLDSDDSDTQVEARAVGMTDTRTGGSAKRNIDAAVDHQSHYFGGQAGPAPATTEPAIEVELMDHALTRRRDWTPVKDTVTRGMGEQTPEQSPAAGETFSALIRGFEYTNPESGLQSKAAQPPPKRRKTAASDAPKVPKARAKKAKEPKTPKVKAPKAPKAPKPPKEPAVKKAKKKPQTITALAMAPYRPQDLTSPQITIPEVLVATKPPSAVEDHATGADATTTKRKADTTASAAKPKRARKPAKPKPAKAEEIPRVLLPPTQAQGALSNQIFIFGTSSQLHAEESPETLKQIQHVLLETESSPLSAHAYSPVRKSRTKVPTAPHGTSLSIGQANRDLWCVSARDDDGGMLVTDTTESHDSRIDSVHEALPCSEVDQPCAVDQEHVPQQDAAEQQQRDQSPSNAVLISSDSPTPEDIDSLPLKQVLARMTSDNAPAYNASPLRSQLPWPSAQRSVLQPLDANLGLRPPQTNDCKQMRPVTSSTQPTTTESLVRPRPRGRPPKIAQIPSNAADVVQISSSPAVLKDSAPRQSTSPSKILATLQSSPPSEWHNIDEISDSETPPTPSPPRKRPSASPVQEPALELTAQDDVEDPLPVFASKAPAKENESQWTSVLAQLYPRITSTIRAVPRSNSLTNPTWHEKILLYDPIVIEDLTTWLNAQGLRVTVRRTSKPKGRKKNTVPEVEVTEEELSNWMVQKWCEEHSICCLWKEGLRGGVRTRY